MGDQSQWIIAEIVVLLVALFFVGRKFAWWYFGIDRALAHLASIDESLKQLPVVQRHQFEVAHRSRKSA